MTGSAVCGVEADRDRADLDASRLLADLSGLVSPPNVCVKLFELVQSARASADEIGSVVALDPNLAARLLRIVNSAIYGFASRVETIPRAVTILGTRDLYNLVLAIAAVRSFSKVGSGLVRAETFWRHSIFCALVARELAKQCRLADADRFFVAGLLHDIGACVIYSQLPDIAPAMRIAAQAGEAALCDAELEQLGFSHATVGALVLQQWQLPVELQAAVRHHHDPASAQLGAAEAALVHIADVLANHSQTGALAANPAPVSELGDAASAVDDAAWGALGTEPASLDLVQVLADASAGFAEATRLLMPAKR